MANQQVLPGMLPDLAFGDELEFWETPAWAIEAIVPVLTLRMRRRPYWSLIDPGCGRGAVLGTLRRDLRASLGTIDGVELDEARASEAAAVTGAGVTIHRGDYLAWSPTLPKGSPLLVAGNPPYSRAIEFVEHSVELAAAGGIIAMLLQLDFATGAERTARVHDWMRSGLYPLRRRPNFGGESSSGKRPFAWFVWDLGEPYSEWRVI